MNPVYEQIIDGNLDDKSLSEVADLILKESQHAGSVGIFRDKPAAYTHMTLIAMLSKRINELEKRIEELE